MPHQPSRTALVAVALLSLLAACAAPGGGTRRSAPVPPPAGHRTVVEHHLPGGAVVVEVVRGGGAVRARSWAEVVDGSGDGPQPLLAEIRIGTDHWVQLPALATEGVIEPGWIHLDLSDPAERGWLEANSLGLVEAAELWSARAGDRFGGDVITSVDAPSASRRVVRLAGGVRVTVTREELHRRPRIAPPTSPSVVPLREVERLLPPGRSGS